MKRNEFVKMWLLKASEMNGPLLILLIFLLN